MKFGIFAISGLTLAMALSASAFAGTINGAEITGGKYASSKCTPPAPAGLVIRTIKSGTAFTKAAVAHNEFSEGINAYQKCRTDELSADQGVMVEQTKAELEALVAISNQEAADLTAKQKELKR
jgi:hypothetical protein